MSSDSQAITDAENFDPFYSVVCCDKFAELSTKVKQTTTDALVEGLGSLLRELPSVNKSKGYTREALRKFRNCIKM